MNSLYFNLKRWVFFSCNFETMACLLFFHPDELLLDKFQPMKMYQIDRPLGPENPGIVVSKY